MIIFSQGTMAFVDRASPALLPLLCGPTPRICLNLIESFSYPHQEKILAKQKKHGA